MSTRLSFAYLHYTINDFGKALLGVFKSSKAAKSWMDATRGEYVPVEPGSIRVLQKINKETGQIWYVEKHVMRDSF